MEETHYREGDQALLQYNVAKSPGDDENVLFVLTGVYETVQGVDDHIEQAHGDEHHDPFVKWIDQCKVTFIRET